MLLTRVGQTSAARAAKIMSCLLPEIQRSRSMQGCYQEFVEPRRKVVRDVLKRGVDTGELRPDLDVELALNLLYGPVLLQALMHWNPAVSSKDLAARVVDAVLAGIGGPQLHPSSI